MIFSRKTILVVGAAFLAACGDKVSVQQYTPPVPVAKVNSVEVAPATASMLVGETATFTAAVNADAGVATTVTWNSSDAAKASVSTAGVVTAVAATPGVAICATSTVDTGKKGCATVAVRVATATGLTVAPSSATLNIGNTLQLTAAVSGATATPTWTTSNAAAVTVSTTGLVTAVAATPGAAVCASAAGFSSCATIVVSGVVVTGVSVVPATATINSGGTQQFTASVAGSGGATNTFTWASGDAAIASVDANGKATAVAASGSVAICATSTQVTSQRGCAQLTIVAPTPLTPATVAINSVTQNAVAGSPTVNPAAVVGNVDVTVNYNSGSYIVNKVELWFGGQLAGTQTLTVPQAMALRYASEQAAAGQAASPQIVFTINTAAFNATTGAPTWTNGAQALQAKLYTTVSGTSAATASASLNETLANVNTFSASSSVANATAANSATGYTYTKGDLTISVIPISYTGAVFTSGTVTFGTGGATGCDANLTAQRTLALTAPAAGAAAWTATFAAGAAAAAGNLTSYEFNNAGVTCPAGSLNTGERFAVTVAQDATGASWATLPIAVGSFYRIDNKAPSAPALTMTVGRRNASWVNDAVLFNATAANGGIITGASVDAGVGLPATEAATYTTTVATFGVMTTAATLAESNLNTTYSATTKGADRLGNNSAASVAATFGVDRTIPTMPANSLPADQAVIAAPTGVAFGAFTYSDPATLPAGPSTPSATPARVTVRRWTSATAFNYSTGAAWGAAGGASVSFNIGLAGAPFIDVAGPSVEGYYVVSAFLEDGAINPSASVTRTYLYDITAPTGPFTIPVMTASAGASNLFSSSLNDNVDLASSQWAFNYPALAAAPGAAGATILLPATSIGGFQTWTKTGTDAMNYPLYRSMTGVAGGVPVFPGAQLATVAHQTADRAGLLQTFAATSVAIPAVNLPTMAVADPYAAALFAGTGFSVTNAAITVDISGNGVLPIVNSVDLTATAVGTVNTMPLPFARVEFYVYDAGSNTYRYLGASSSATVVDNATNRVYTWTVNWNPDAVGQYNNPVAAGAQTIVAIGINSTFDAVRSAANVNITTAP